MPVAKQTFAPQTRSFDLARSSINEDARTVDVVFSTETDSVQRWFGVEILDHSPKSVRMGRLQNKAAVLRDHDHRDHRGVVESASMSKSGGTATLRISRSDRGEELWRDILDGIVSKISVGYRVHAITLESTDKKTGIDTFRVTDWEPFELSFVSIPADDSAGIRSDSDQGNSIFGSRAASLSTQITMKKPAPENEGRAGNEEGQDPNVTAPATPAAPENQARSAEQSQPTAEQIEARARELATEQTRSELARIADINSVGDLSRQSKEDIATAIKAGISGDEFRVQVFEAMAKSNPSYSTARTENENQPEVGTRAFTAKTWGESALRALGSRAKGITLPEYKEFDVSKRTIITGSVIPFHRDLTLVDVAKSDVGIGTPIIDETIAATPEFSLYPVDVITGDTVSLSVQVGNPSIKFRIANNGTDSVKGDFVSRMFQTGIIDEHIDVDINGVLNASRDPSRLLMSHSGAALKGAMKAMAFQNYYGGTAMSGDDAAPPGLIAQASADADHTVDATGTTGKTSVWIVELGLYSLDHIYGNNSTISFGDDWIETVSTGVNGKPLRVLQNWMSARWAPRLANKNAAVRIKNVSAETGKTLTDALLAEGMQKAKDLGMNPNAIFMTSRSHSQWRASRTTYSPTGEVAPLPTNFDGVPVYSSNNISNSETV